MKKINLSILTILVVVFFLSCKNSADQSKENMSTNEIKPLVEKVLTAEEQAALTPDEVIKMLKSGNKRFMNNTLTERDHSAQVRNSSLGQFPKAVIISCLDSRVPVEDVFDRGIGDIFVGRVAGNFVNTDLLGSMEFGCAASGAKLVMILGHEHCGAILGAINKVELGNITAMLENIKPAIEMTSDFEGEKSPDNEFYVNQVIENNIIHTINKTRADSPILKEMEENGEIKIVGAMYNMETGEVVFQN